MAAVRRSTRLSSVSSRIETPTRRAEIWRRRQTKNAAEATDDEDTISEQSTDAENSENYNSINKMKSQQQRKNIKTTKKDKTSNVEEPKTPSRRSTKRASKLVDYIDAADSDEEDNKPQVSPPKQTRKAQPKHIISPSRLIERLSIDEREAAQASESENDEEEQEQAIESETQAARNKYQNARRVLNVGVTENLPGREPQLQVLREFFAKHLQAQTSASLYVSGPPGTGKTACLSLLLRKTEFGKSLRSVYINCTSIASVGGVYKKLCAELQLQPSGRTERHYLDEIKRYLQSSKRMILIVLDEIDQLCNTKQSVLYTIFEWPAMPSARLLLVGIANSLDLTDRALVRLNARCELKPQLLHFPPYSKQQIVEIFKARLQEADVLDIFPPVTLQLLAAKVSAVNGDVRRALDIGRHVVEIAEQKKKAGQRKINMEELGAIVDDKQQEDVLQPVQVSQVAAVLNKVYGASQNLQDDIEDSFPLQQKLMLCTLMLILRNERNKDISMARLHEVYKRICVKRNIQALDQAEFVGMVDLVETRGILRIMRKKEPRLNKVQLQWDEEEVNGALRDKQLIAVILDDTTCLGK